MSENTRRRFGPHPLTEEEAFRICQSLDNQHLRFVAILKNKPRIIAYFLIFLGVLPDDRQRYEILNIELNNQKDCTLAPSVADDFQAKKLGSLLMPIILKACKMIDYQRVILWGGVQASNERAVHFYQKFGFNQVGEFQNQNGNNFDMILTL